MKLRWSEHARRDLDDIRRYIARDDAEAARRHIARIRECARRAAAFPLAGRRLPELESDDYREVILGNYRVVYRVGVEGITVVTVFEGHRLFRP